MLTYDLRNFGQSGAANGGVFSVGNFESWDVVGSLDYVRSRTDTKGMTIGLFSRCVGSNATMFAMTRRPDVFEGVRCMVSPQPWTCQRHCLQTSSLCLCLMVLPGTARRSWRYPVISGLFSCRLTLLNSTRLGISSWTKRHLPGLSAGRCCGKSPLTRVSGT